MNVEPKQIIKKQFYRKRKKSSRSEDSRCEDLERQKNVRSKIKVTLGIKKI